MNGKSDEQWAAIAVRAMVIRSLLALAAQMAALARVEGAK